MRLFSILVHLHFLRFWCYFVDWTDVFNAWFRVLSLRAAKWISLYATLYMPTGIFDNFGTMAMSKKVAIEYRNWKFDENLWMNSKINVILCKERTQFTFFIWTNCFIRNIFELFWLPRRCVDSYYLNHIAYWYITCKYQWNHLTLIQHCT